MLHRQKLPLIAIFAKKINFWPICGKNGQFKLQLIGFHLEMALFRTEKAIVSPSGLRIFTGEGGVESAGVNVKVRIDPPALLI